MTYDYKRLCAELVELGSSPARSVSELAERMSQVMDLADRARVALAKPEPEGPTDEELILTYAFAVAEAVNAMCKPLKPEDYKYAQLAGLRAVLVRWGNHPGFPDSSLQPVPVSECLPRLEDCDAEGRCWLCGKVEGDWRLINPSKSGVPQLKYCFSHWLPAHALPQPS